MLWLLFSCSNINTDISECACEITSPKVRSFCSTIVSLTCPFGNIPCFYLVQKSSKFWTHLRRPMVHHFFHNPSFNFLVCNCEISVLNNFQLFEIIFLDAMDSFCEVILTFSWVFNAYLSQVWDIVTIV